MQGKIVTVLALVVCGLLHSSYGATCNEEQKSKVKNDYETCINLLSNNVEEALKALISQGKTPSKKEINDKLCEVWNKINAQCRTIYKPCFENDPLPGRVSNSIEDLKIKFQLKEHLTCSASIPNMLGPMGLLIVAVLIAKIF